jgi:hypothetical protein
VLLKNYLTVDKDWEPWRAYILDLSTNLSEALVSRQVVTLRSKHISQVNLDLSSNQDSLVNGIKLLMVFSYVVCNSMFCGNLLNTSYKIIHILLGDVNVASNHTTLLGCLLDVDS